VLSKTKNKLQQGLPVCGVTAATSDPFLTEIIGGAGFDYVLVDMQHSPLDPNDLYERIKGLGRTDSDIIVRVVANKAWMIGQALDMGADGVIIPLVDNADEAKLAVKAAKYPPIGERSSGPRKTWRLGSDYMKKANDEIIVWPQIETKGAIDDIDAFLQVEGVDGIMIGPTDLALSLGFSQDRWNDPKVEETFQYILDKCKEHNVPWGMFSGITDGLKWVKRGGQIITAGFELSYIQEGASADLNTFKSLIVP